MERKYDVKLIDEAIVAASTDIDITNSNDRGRDKGKEKTGINVPFITNYFKGANRVKNIIQKNWSIIRNDPLIGHEFPSRPKIIFRKSPNLKEIITSHYIKSKNEISHHLKGFFNCGRYKACQEAGQKRKNKPITSFRLRDGTIQKIRALSTCDSKNVIYVIQCPCGLRYMGRTQGD